jgi:hypothetical protein
VYPVGYNETQAGTSGGGWKVIAADSHHDDMSAIAILTEVKTVFIQSVRIWPCSGSKVLTRGG